MKQQTDLLSRICDLYEYDDRLKSAFDDEVAREAARAVQAKGKPRDIQELNRVADQGNFSWETMRLGLEFPVDTHLETIVVNAISEAEGVVRPLHAASQTPYEKSLAWLLAVQWFEERVSPSIEDVETNLEFYCSQHVVGRDGDRVGLRMEHRLRQRRRKDQSFRLLQKAIGRLDTPGNVRNLLQRLWDRCPTEARQIGLPKPKKPGPVQRTLVWVRDNIVAAVIVGILVAALLGLFGLG